MAAQQTQSSPADVDFHELVRELAYTKAVWDIELYAPGRGNEDLPDELNNRLMDAHSKAFDRLMREPAQTLGELARKLRVFQDEDGHGTAAAGTYCAIFAEDARRLFLQSH